jgi:hypothetical protein
MRTAGAREMIAPGAAEVISRLKLFEAISVTEYVEYCRAFLKGSPILSQLLDGEPTRGETRLKGCDRRASEQFPHGTRQNLAGLRL